ncbi:hypothetical protein OG937_02015 [Streptomyces sp. NBC_00510]
MRTVIHNGDGATTDANCGTPSSAHRFCPVCGKLPPATIAFDALQADSVRLDALSDLPHQVQATLREQGVFTRNWVDTIENVVGVVEARADSVFRTAVANAEDLLRGKGNIGCALRGFAVCADARPPHRRRHLTTDARLSRPHGSMKLNDAAAH